LPEGFAWTALKPAIGAEVRIDKATALGGEHAGEIRGLLEDRTVLVFPRLGLTRDELVAFTRSLGTYQPDHADGRTTAITLDPAANASADYVKASFFWHFDGYMNETPILASLLSAEALSETGGDTEFCNTAAAYDALPEARKRQLEGLRAVHAMAAAQLAVEPEPSHERFREWMKVRSAELPLVWTHRGGGKSLVIGNTALAVKDMDPIAGLELLVELRDWATQDRFRYRHGWSVGDLVMWDNTRTLHRATPYPAGSGRLLHRAKLAGEEPVA
jgi:alpha-ketoglutarate-dependent taurine dioxygenase